MLRSNPYTKLIQKNTHQEVTYRQIYFWLDAGFKENVPFSGRFASRVKNQDMRWHWGYFNDNIHELLSELIHQSLQSTHSNEQQLIDLVIDISFLNAECDELETLKKNSSEFIAFIQSLAYWPDAVVSPQLWYVDSSELTLSEAPISHPDHLMQQLVCKLQPLKSDQLLHELNQEAQAA